MGNQSPAPNREGAPQSPATDHSAQTTGEGIRDDASAKGATPEGDEDADSSDGIGPALGSGGDAGEKGPAGQLAHNSAERKESPVERRASRVDNVPGAAETDAAFDEADSEHLKEVVEDATGQPDASPPLPSHITHTLEMEVLPEGDARLPADPAVRRARIKAAVSAAVSDEGGWSPQRRSELVDVVSRAAALPASEGTEVSLRLHEVGGPDVVRAIVGHDGESFEITVFAADAFRMTLQHTVTEVESGEPQLRRVVSARGVDLPLEPPDSASAAESVVPRPGFECEIVPSDTWTLGQHEINQLDHVLEQLGSHTDPIARGEVQRMLRAMIDGLPQDRRDRVVHLRVFVRAGRLRMEIDTADADVVDVLHGQGLAYDDRPFIVGTTFKTDGTGTTWVELPLNKCIPILISAIQKKTGRDDIPVPDVGPKGGTLEDLEAPLRRLLLDKADVEAGKDLSNADKQVPLVEYHRHIDLITKKLSRFADRLDRQKPGEGRGDRVWAVVIEAGNPGHVYLLLRHSSGDGKETYKRIPVSDAGLRLLLPNDIGARGPPDNGAFAIFFDDKNRPVSLSPFDLSTVSRPPEDMTFGASSEQPGDPDGKPEPADGGSADGNLSSPASPEEKKGFFKRAREDFKRRRQVRRENPLMRRMVQANTVSATGNSVLNLTFLTLLLGGSPAAAGLVAAVATLPGLILAPFAGIATDKFDRRRILLWSQGIGMAATAATVMLTFFVGLPAAPVLAIGGFIEAAALVFSSKASQLVIQDLAPTLDDVDIAVQWDEAQEHTATTLGSGAAPGLARWSTWAPFGINFLSYIPTLSTVLRYYDDIPPGNQAKPHPVPEPLRRRLRTLRDNWPGVLGALRRGGPAMLRALRRGGPAMLRALRRGGPAMLGALRRGGPAMLPALRRGGPAMLPALRHGWSRVLGNNPPARPYEPQEEKPQRVREVLRGLRGAWSRTLQEPVLRALTLSTAVSNAGFMFLGLRAATVVLHAEAWVAGAVVAAGGAGGLVGSLGVSTLLKRANPKVVLPLAAVGMAVSAAAQALTLNPLWLILGTFLVSLCGVTSNVVFFSYLFKTTPRSLHGRVISANATISGTGTLLGRAVGGFALAGLGIGGQGLVGAGAAVAGAVIVTALLVPRNRIPLLRRLSAQPKEGLADFGERVRLSNGKELYANSYGPKDAEATVLMVPDTPGGRLGPRPPLDWLEKNKIRLIIPDPPGVGHSDRQPGQTVAEAARDLLAVADHFGLDEFGIIGLGTGGPIALELARQAHGRASRLSVIGGPHADMTVGTESHPAYMDDTVLMDVMYQEMYFPDEPRRADVIKNVAKSIDSDALKTLDVMHDLERRVPGPALADEPDLRFQLADSMAAGVSEGGWEGWLDRAETISSGDWGIDWNLLPEKRLVTGALDCRFPPRHARANARLIPGAQLQIVPDATQFDVIKRLPAEILWAAGKNGPDLAA